MLKKPYEQKLKQNIEKYIEKTQYYKTRKRIGKQKKEEAVSK